MDLKQHIRSIPDFPEAGIMFRDITPLLSSPSAFNYVIEALADHYKEGQIDVLCAIEARGFLFGAPMARLLGKPLVPMRKPGKLPYKTSSVSYSLEYGSDSIEVHCDSVSAGQRVVIVDDLLATGGTMAAACKLIRELGGIIEGTAFVIELPDLHGRQVLEDYEVFSLIRY